MPTAEDHARFNAGVMLIVGEEAIRVISNWHEACVSGWRRNYRLGILDEDDNRDLRGYCMPAGLYRLSNGYTIEQREAWLALYLEIYGHPEDELNLTR